ncbi:universal stress protein [Mucilaginibacter rubeus]|uniref:Universal stress protein n=1 Tax=Mucilaginibacter rubeus TaxID=2027860 RepID=A0AAE6JKX8_9SPHI|nr:MULTISPECIES: universal stress protein [Mucilaginibacter]QEM07649.1 universal stress protein [Mucilaginibacter rubeus]QEM20104.1 universal stress protein [Mucilaginibacter gossypii]QTE43183.1 universal stress protein [Mucilaginibacter rubeus]QTE49783.1 universal stress protein [Mucilaginibacter rubeus]QTE54877.1 universal stress protein [Mucilaginibacter rubeus]
MSDFKKILIATDDGPTSEIVALKGFQLGKKLNAEIALVSVVDTTVLVSETGATSRELAEIIKSNHVDNQQILIEKVFGDFKIWSFVEQGNPYEAILRVAKEWEADLVVLGTHGRTALSSLLVGSVSEKVIRHSTIPIFIVPTKHD